MYEAMIREAMARLGRVGEAEPDVVEAWMRVEHGTLDHLSAAAFQADVEVALDCAAQAGAEANHRLAVSQGLRAESQVCGSCGRLESEGCADDCDRVVDCI